jgi:hypothetical protein
MEKLRVCVLFAGQFRNSYGFSKDFLNWLRNQDNIDSVDCYIHAWWDQSYVGKYYSFKNSQVVEENPKENIIEELNPNELLLQPQAVIDLDDLPFNSEASGTTSLSRESTYFSIISQFKSLKRCAELVDFSSYDCIIRARTDLLMTKPHIKWGITKELLKSDNVFIADGKFFTGWPLGDHIFVGNPVIMKRLCENYYKLYIEVHKEVGYQMELHNYIPRIINKINGIIRVWDIWIRLGQATQYLDGYNPENNLPYWYEFLNKERLKIPAKIIRV